MATNLGQIIPINEKPTMITTLPKESLVVLSQSAKALILRVIVAGHCIFRLWYKLGDVWWPLNGLDEAIFEAMPSCLEGKNERVYSAHSEAREFCLELEDGALGNVLFASVREVIPGELV